MTAILECRDISVRYGRAAAVTDVSLAVGRGEILAVVGANGAGKSTLLAALVGAVPSTGTLLLDGSVVTSGTAERARRGISFVPQGRLIFPRLSVADNLQVMASVLRVRRQAADAALDRFPVLRRRAGAAAGVLSGGEQQMLALARALLRRPKVLLLDEAATGLAPQVVDEVLQVTTDLAAQGVAVVMAEPMVAQVNEIITGGVVLQRGRVVARSASASELDAQLATAVGLTD